MPDPLAAVSTRRTPQSEQADLRQVRNDAGGWAFKTSRDARLHRFLTLGVDGGTFYVKEHALAKQNAEVVLDWARNDATELVRRATEISLAGRAPRNNPALFAVAAALGLGDDAGRKAAAAAVPLVARTGTHLFTLAGYAQQFRGWGRGLRRAVGGWYLGEPGKVAYQMLKYRQRDGWTHRDLLRLSHPQAVSPAHRALFDFACGRDADLADLPLVAAFRAAQANTGGAARWVSLIRDNPALSWEMLPDAALAERAVWEALVDAGMPMTALIRKLPVLTQRGLLGPMKSGYTAKVCAQLADQQKLLKARVHPVQALLAMKTYATGRSQKGDSTWTPSQPVVDALDAAYYASYGTVEPSGKRTMLAVDISGSMTWNAAGHGIMCSEAAMALALVIAATEPETMIMGFSTRLVPLPVSPRQRLDDALRVVYQMTMGGTDPSLPMLEAIRNKWEIDHFCVLTDNEGWAGKLAHPHQALVEYRQKTGINARLSAVALAPVDFTIADPADPGSLDVSGMDAAVPRLLADFARGDI